MLSNLQEDSVGVMEQRKIWSWILSGPETKNDCVVEGQQFTAMLVTRQKYGQGSHKAQNQE